MRFESKTSKVIILELNEEEAEYIKGIMQNPLCKNESIHETKIRSLIFHGLKKALED